MASARSVIINFVANDRVTDAVKGIGKQFDKLNGQVKKAAGPAMAAAGATAGAALVGGITNAIQLQSARSKLEAQLGLTKAQSAKVGQAAGKLYSQAYGDSMEDVQGAITSVIQNMDGMRDASTGALQQMTARAMNTASVMDEEVGGVTNAVSQMLRTGLAKSAQEAFDTLVAGTQRGANKAQDLLDTFNEYGTQFRKLGLDGKTAMGLIQQGLQGGARDADLVADALKEFSIRAVDGSATTIAGFKSLGLNATQMAKQIASGGSNASKGLDTVLGRLRAVKDPVKQAQIATELFGTQAEDLGKALFSLDPSHATQALGQVGGAADKAGKQLHDNATAKFEQFKRTLTQNVTNAVVTVVGWFQKHTTAAKVLAGAAATLTGAWAAYNAVALTMAARTALMTEGTAANLIVTKLSAAASKAWAAATWLLNAAMDANPIMLVVLAIVALVAGFVIAYKKSETFRNIVNGVWNAIKTGVMTAVNFIVGFVRDHWKLIIAFLLGPLGPAFLIISTFWKQIWGAIQAAWALIQPILMAIVNFIKGVFVVAWIVIQNTIKIVWIAIQIYIKVAWTLIKGYFTLIKLYITQVLAPVFMWLYSNVVKPVWGWIRSAISAAWGFIKGIWNSLRSYLSGPMSTAFHTFKAVIGTVWGGVKAVISTVTGQIKTIFNGLKTAVGAVKNAFHTAVDGIKTIWDKLKGIAKTPVNFIIGLYNDGIVSLVNKLAGFAGVKTRLTKVPKFAGGGVMPGYAPGRDSLIAAVAPGESIFRPEFTKAVGSNWVTQANAVARSGGPGAVRKWLTGANQLGGEGLGFARGGTVPGFAGRFGFGGIVGGFVKGLKNFALKAPEKAMNTVLGKILGGKIPGSGTFHDLIAAIPKWIKDQITKWFKGKVSGGIIGGKGFAIALSWARSQAGKPYVWGGVGPGGYDCSGFMSAITNVIHGKNPYSRLFSTRSFSGSGGPGGFVRNQRSAFEVGVTNAGVGHMAGTLNGVNVESSGSRGVHLGSSARGAHNGLFPAWYGLKADTGALALAPGWNPPVFNGTGRNEYLETPRSSGDIHLHLENHGAIGSRLELQDWLTKALEGMKQRGRL
jgi:phage-related minor tail protein